MWKATHTVSLRLEIYQDGREMLYEDTLFMDVIQGKEATEDD